MKKFNVSERKSDYRYTPRPYDYDGLAHYWSVNFTYESTAGGRMSAYGNSIKSYSTIIARMYNPAKGENQPIVLITTQEDGNTTNIHKNAVISATMHMNQIFVGYPSPNSKKEHIRNLNILLEKQILLAESYSQKRTDHTRVEVVRSMELILNNTETYAKYFKVKNTKEYKALIKIPIPGADDFEEKLALSTKDRMSSNRRAANAKAKMLAEKNKENAALAEMALSKWLRGEDVHINTKYISEIHLRIRDGFVETTSHAKITLLEATKAYIRFKKGNLKVDMHVGPFTFGGIDDGNYAHIGCHVIPMKKIDSLMKTIIKEENGQ